MSASLGERLARVRQQVAEAAGARHVTLVAASKFQPDEALRALHALGVRDFGENYPQALAARASALSDLTERCTPVTPAGPGARPRWHLLGGLQRNKARLVAPVVDVVHSIDGLPVAEALSKAWQACGRVSPIDIFLQVDLGDAGGARRGLSAGALPALVAGVRPLPGLRLVGLMGLPPRGVPAAPAFRRLAALGRRLQEEGGAFGAAAELSMGMSDDFSLAIAEGATVVRIGSALFGPRGRAEAALGRS